MGGFDVPTALFAVGMTQPLLPPRGLGMLGLITFYQMLYGTLVYFFQFFNCGRHMPLARSLVLGVVVPANSIWIALPAVGLWASARLIVDGTFAVFRDGMPL